jgi:hypothetical protein
MVSRSVLATCRSSPSRYTNLPSSLPGYPRPSLWRSSHAQSGPRCLGVANGSHELPTGSGSNCAPGVFWLQPRSPARWLGWRPPDGIAPPEELMPGSYTRVHQTQHHHPARAWAGRHHPGVVGEPAASRRLYAVRTPPWVVGAGSGRVPGPKFAAGTAAGAAWRIFGPPGGPEIRWILSVGWCPSKRVVGLHCARPHTAQKASGGCVRAISGSASKFAEDTCYEKLMRGGSGVN